MVRWGLRHGFTNPPPDVSDNDMAAALEAVLMEEADRLFADVVALDRMTEKPSSEAEA